MAGARWVIEDRLFESSKIKVIKAEMFPITEELPEKDIDHRQTWGLLESTRGIGKPPTSR